MAAIVFPQSSSPGERPGEGQGRLVNAMAVADGSEIKFDNVPGLQAVADLGRGGPRGMLVAGPLLYVAVQDRLLSMNGNLAPTVLLRGLAGEQPVSMARNNKAPKPDVVIVGENGAFVVSDDGASVQDYPDDTVGFPADVAELNGYMILAYQDATIRATGEGANPQNSLVLNELSKTIDQSRGGGILRGVVKDGVYVAFKANSMSFYRDVGTSPFPLARATEAVDVGLWGKWCLAGNDAGWDGPLFWIAQDGSLRRLAGYQPQRVSWRPFELAVSRTVDRQSIRMCVYTFEGNSILSISGPEWTWEYNVTTDRWHERESYGLKRWRAQFSVNAFSRWLLGDTISASLLSLAPQSRQEAGEPLVWTVEGVMRDFPTNAVVPTFHLNISTGEGREFAASDPARDPQVGVAWSLDDGASWSEPLLRDIGRQGQRALSVRVNPRVRAREQGFRLRLEISDPVDFLMGAAVVPSLQGRGSR